MAGSELDFHLLVATLRTDRADVESYSRVLSDTLGAALPQAWWKSTAAAPSPTAWRAAPASRWKCA